MQRMRLCLRGGSTDGGYTGLVDEELLEERRSSKELWLVLIMAPHSRGKPRLQSLHVYEWHFESQRLHTHTKQGRSVLAARSYHAMQRARLRFQCCRRESPNRARRSAGSQRRIWLQV